MAARTLRQRVLVVAIVVLAAGALALDSPAVAGAADVGFKGPNTSGNSNPTAEKPESKLWFNDGIWWGALWDSVSPRRYEIFRLDTGTQTWTSTNVPIDSRAGTHVDTLWDGTNLYVASHNFTTSPGPGGPSNLYRYSYNAATDTYTLDPGFPAVINSENTEALVIDEDSLGNLWATWMRANQIWVSHTSGNDAVWGTPFVLPTTDAGSVSSDDMSSLIAFNGRIGVMYSDQTDNNMHFAVHVDGASDSAWTHENAYGPQTNCPATSCADDHMNLKAFGGKVYAATKTSLGGSNPLINLLVRDTNGSWSAHVFGTAVSTQDHTRPIVLIDATSGVVHMFATGSAPGSLTYDLIYEKTAPLANISFAPGAGTPFIDPDGSTPQVNNATSTKQNLTNDMGLVVIASGGSNYWHNDTPLAPDTTPPVIQSAVANGSTLTMTYSELLNTASVPAPGAFAVTGGHSVTGVNITGTTVVLTLAPAVTAGGTGLTLSYTPGASPIEDLAGNDAAALVNQVLTNSTGSCSGSQTLVPNADVSASEVKNEAGGTANLYASIDEGVATSDNGTTLILNNKGAAASYVAELTCSPSDFTSMSALTIDARLRTSNQNDDQVTLFAQVFRSDGTTPLTNEIGVATNPGTSGFVTISGVAFTGVVAADKAAWDGARLKLRWAHTIVGTSTAQLKVSAVELDATGSSGPDGTPPVFQSASVNGSSLTMTYDEALNTGSVPANGDFSISGGHSVTNRNVTGSTVVLTLSPVTNGEVITLSYTKGANPIEDLAGNDAANLVNATVTNNTPPVDGTPPVFQSAAVNGTSLTMTYNEALNTGSVPANGDFSISGGHSVTNRNVTGSTVVLTLSPAVVNGEVVTLSYTKGTNPIEDLAGNDADNLVTVAVANTPGGGGGSLTLLPNADVSLSNLTLVGAATAFDAINETIAAADDGTTLIRNSGTAGSSFVGELSATPAAFASMSTLTIDVRVRTTNWVDDNVTLFAQVFRSDGTTPLTNEVAATTGAATSGGFTTVSGITLTGLAGADKATWDGARLKLRWGYAVVGSSDGAQLKLTAVELDGTF